MSLIGMIFYRGHQRANPRLRIWLSDPARYSRSIWPSRHSWHGPVLIDTRSHRHRRTNSHRRASTKACGQLPESFCLP